jgi:hypothetical protein
VRTRRVRMLDAIMEKGNTLVLFDSPWWIHLWEWAGARFFVRWPLARLYQGFMCAYWDKLKPYAAAGVRIPVSADCRREFERRVWKVPESLLLGENRRA